MKLIDSIFESLGVKRLVASLLSVIVEVLKAIPGAGEYITVVDMIAGFFGITGISHAAAIPGALTRKKLATASAAVATLTAVCLFIPPLAPFIPYLQKLAALFGAAALGAQAKQVEVQQKANINPQRISAV